MEKFWEWMEKESDYPVGRINRETILKQTVIGYMIEYLKEKKYKNEIMWITSIKSIEFLYNWLESEIERIDSK